MTDYNIEVKLLAITPDSADLTEQAGRLQARIKQGHESLIEHASATFYVKASRALTHELVRHRIAAYSQRSQRYVKETEAEFITPPELAGNEGAITIYQEAMEAAWTAYKKLLHSGIKAEIARYVLPNACTTEIICTWNFREIRHIIKLRSGPAALPEMRAVANAIKVIMKNQAPKVFGDLE